MKKENKKIAQQRKAEEKKKQARKNILGNVELNGKDALFVVEANGIY